MKTSKSKSNPSEPPLLFHFKHTVSFCKETLDWDMRDQSLSLKSFPYTQWSELKQIDLFLSLHHSHLASTFSVWLISGMIKTSQHGKNGYGQIPNWSPCSWAHIVHVLRCPLTHGGQQTWAVGLSSVRRQNSMGKGKWEVWNKGTVRFFAQFNWST